MSQSWYSTFHGHVRFPFHLPSFERYTKAKRNKTSGDFPSTAAAIARKVGLFTHRTVHSVKDLDVNRAIHNQTYNSAESHHVDRSLLLSGKDLESLTGEQWSLVVLYDEVVFARTTPEQKLRIVHEFQDHDYVVGVTGDGVNGIFLLNLMLDSNQTKGSILKIVDAPALKAANIGVAMGSGSDVAMEAAALVLLNSNFASISVALEAGRLVFDNLKKVYDIVFCLKRYIMQHIHTPSCTSGLLM